MTNSAPWWSPLLASLVTALLTLSGAWLISSRSLKHQAEQERLKDARNLRDRKFERLRVAYVVLLSTIWSIRSMAIALEAFSSENTKGNEASLRSSEDTFAKTVADITSARMALLVEGESSEALALFDRSFTAWNAVKYNIWNQSWLGKDDPHWQEIEEGMQQLSNLAQRRMGELQVPLP